MANDNSSNAAAAMMHGAECTVTNVQAPPTTRSLVTSTHLVIW